MGNKMNLFQMILDKTHLCLLIIIIGLTFIFGKYLWNNNTSLKVIIPLCCLILGLTICAVVASCKYKPETKQMSDEVSTVIIKEINSETDIPENEQAEIIKAYIIIPKEK